MIFLVMGVAYALRISFTLLLTQMVYIPNSNSSNGAYDPNGMLSCPVKHSSSPNETTIIPVRENYIKKLKIGK